MAKYNWHKGFYYYLYHNKLQMVRRNYTIHPTNKGSYVLRESTRFGGGGLCWYCFDLSELNNPDTVEEGYLYLTERDDEKAKSIFLENAKKELAYQESRREWLNTIKEGA